MTQNQKFTLCHISDLHFSSPGEISFDDFFNKRILGGLNVLLFRRFQYRFEVLKSLRDLLCSNNFVYDHLLVSGDLTSTGKESEFLDAKKFLLSLKEKSPVSVIPGNHDVYIKELEEPLVFSQFFGQDFDCLEFPFLHKIKQGVYVAGFNTCYAAGVLSSAGRVNPEEITKMKTLLKDIEPESVVLSMGHYHLAEKADPNPEHDLTNPEEMLDFLKESGIKYYFHGHIHDRFCLEKHGINLLNCGSSSRFSRKRPATMHRLNFEGKSLKEIEVWAFNRDQMSFEKTETVRPPFESL